MAELYERDPYYSHELSRNVDLQAKIRGMNEYACDVREKLIQTCSLAYQLRRCVDTADGILEKQNSLVRHSIEVSANCERLSEEVQVLTKRCDEIGEPLKHYNAVDEVGPKIGILFKASKDKNIVTVRGSPKIKVDDDEEFAALLNLVDEACAFFSGKEELDQESYEKEYGRRAEVLQDAAVFMIKEAVVDRVKQTTSDITAALNLGDAKSKGVSADKLEASLIYTRFHGISSRSRKLISILQDRVLDRSRNGEGVSTTKAYRDLLFLCQTTYCSSRESLLKKTVNTHIDNLCKEHGLVGMTRLAISFLERVCSNEVSLYRDFFGNFVADGASSSRISAKSSIIMSENELQKMMNSLCSTLHRCVRKGLVQLTDLETLCQVVSVLREERNLISFSKTSTFAASRTMSGVIEDAQERLIFVAQRTLTNNVLKFKPSKSDLDYPDKLEEAAKQKNNKEVDPVQAQLLVYDTWYPPLKSVLKVLSKLFKVVDQQVFEDIALQSVQSCAKALKDAASQLEAKHRGSLDSELFLVKHLLILREQLSPFDVELKSIQRQLDFSEAGKAMTRFLAKRNRHLLTMSNENALIMLLREGVSVQEASVDSKRDLEEALREACNNFITNGSADIVGGLEEFVESCKISSGSKNGKDITGQKCLDSRVIIPLIDTKHSLAKEKMEDLKNRMALYLDNAATQGILLKPVLRKISRTLAETTRYINMAMPGKNGWTEESLNQTNASLQEFQENIKAFMN